MRLSVVSLSRAAWVNGCRFRRHRSQPPGVAFGEWNQPPLKQSTGFILAACD